MDDMTQRACIFAGLWEPERQGPPRLVDRSGANYTSNYDRGSHWVPGRRLECPRLTDQLALDMMLAIAKRGGAVAEVEFRQSDVSVRFRYSGSPATITEGKSDPAFSVAVVMAVVQLAELQQATADQSAE